MDSTPRYWLQKLLRTIASAPGKAFSSTAVILDSLAFPLALVDRRGKIISINKCWMESDWRKGIFGDISVNPGDNYLEICRRAAAAGVLPAGDALKGIGSVCEGSMPSYELEYFCSLPDGDRLHSMAVRPLLCRNGGAIITHRDISQRRAADEMLVDLSGRLIQAREDERSRIARELHDNLSQKVALLSIEIEQLSQLPRQSIAAVNAGLYKVLNKVQEISSEIHRLSHGLHPFKLDRLGLAAAALSLSKEVSSQQSLQVDCDIRDIPEDLPREVALCLYRVIQESLQNIIKHSGACNAVLKLHGSRSEIRLRITDEGVGFAPESVSRKHGMGLIGMRERLRLVGGTISIESQPLRGTQIHVVVPLKPANSASAK
jgi:signal transduction histidine kinase